MWARLVARRPVKLAASVILGVLLLALGAALLAPLLTYPYGRDQGVFAVGADVIARGGVPYQDAWEMKPPGIFYLYLTSFVLFGRSMLAPRLLDLIWTLATAAAIWALGRCLLSSWVGIAGGVLYVVRYVVGHNFWNTTQCEGFTSLPLTLAAIALVAAEQETESPPRFGLWRAGGTSNRAQVHCWRLSPAAGGCGARLPG
jgi:hypothetical protein